MFNPRSCASCAVKDMIPGFLNSEMEYIKDKSEPKDGKLLAIGHSMGGILLYVMLSRCGYEGKDSGLAAVTTLASSLDYMSFRSSLKLLLPLASVIEAKLLKHYPAQVLNVPVIPIGTLLAAAHPFAANPPYLLSWLSPQISALDMLQPKLFETLVTENFIKKICFTFGFQDNAQMLNVDSGIDAFNCHIAHYDIVGAQRLEVVETSSSFKLRSVFFPHEGRSRLKKNLQARGSLFGYDLGVSGGVTSMNDFLKEFFPKVYRRKQAHLHETDYCKYDNQLLTLFTSSLYFAGLVSTFGASYVTRNKGRRASILVGAVSFFLGRAINAGAVNITMLIIGRILLDAGI
ncbi:hypothetical protein GOBAR_DD26284 [Gossypium barbadense]|nr:hypothetical protein GOBAR_DD26284 [Gossypium barbadense]